jgi:hypothetical protein
LRLELAFSERKEKQKFEYYVASDDHQKRTTKAMLALAKILGLSI